MRFILMTADGKLWSTSGQDIDRLQITNFQNWFCDIGTNAIDIIQTGEFFGSSCGNIGKVCHQKMCYKGPDHAIPKATDPESFLKFKQVTADVDFRTLPEYNISCGRPVAMGSVDNLSNILRVTWKLHIRCNYDCSYCPDYIHSMVDDYSDIQTHQQTFLKIPPADKLRVELLGGEPTLWKPLPEFMDWCTQQRPVEFRIMTNGSSNLDRLLEFHQRAQLVISMHDEYVTQKQIDRWIQFLSTTKSKNRVFFKSFLDKPEWMEFFKSTKQYDFVKLTKYQLVDKEQLVLLKTI
jgi:organic radical activating enzyme